MKLLQIVLLGVLILLSVSSGIIKIILMPQEVEFFGGAGFSNLLIVVYGATQIIGGMLLIPIRSRAWAAIFMAVNFMLSVVVIGLSGNIPFAVFSFAPVAISVFIGFVTLKARHSQIIRDALSDTPD